MADKDFIVKNGLVVGGDLTTTLVKFNDNDASNWVAFASPATVSSNITWTLPSADAGVSGYALVSNGSGTLSWAADSTKVAKAGDTMTGDLSFGDNNKATFGDKAGGDLQIYHDSFNSYIKDTGTGNLNIDASNLSFRSWDGAESYIDLVDNSYVQIRHDNAIKLATTATGIDVTGTVVADGLTVGNSNIGSNLSHVANLTINNNGHIGTAYNSTAIQITTTGGVNFKGGDISFYEDTGTTAKFFWDSSAEALGIGTSSPNTVIDARQTSTGASTQIRVYNTDNSNTTTQTAALFLSPDSRGNGALIFAQKENADFSTNAGRDVSLVFSPVLNNSQTEAMRIDSSGNVIVGKGGGTSNASQGVLISQTGEINAHKDSDHVLLIDRGTDDGTLVLLRRDGSTVGSIGAVDSDLYLGSVGSVGLRFNDATNKIVPVNNVGANRDNAIDLGQSDSRFKDLYLSGFVNAATLSVDGGTIKLDGNYPVGSYNVALGDTALNNGSLSGSYNTALGSGVLTSNTTGQGNTGSGYVALTTNTTGVENTAYGRQALYSNSTGSYNTALGRSALEANTTDFNTAVGFEALQVNTTGANNSTLGYRVMNNNITGSNNTAVGRQALNLNTTASNNTAVGYQAGYANTTGASNNFLGYRAGYSNTTGGSNTYIGLDAGYSNLTSGYNVAIGNYALKLNVTQGNIAIGSYVLEVNTSGTGNIGLGTYDSNGNAPALKSNTTGSHNVAIGVRALTANTTGYTNVAIGLSALAANTTGLYNVALGANALAANTTASLNTAVGYSAMYSNTTGTGTAVGSNAYRTNTTGTAGTAVGLNALYNNTTGGNNTALGQEALVSNTTASNNTAVGYQSLYSNITGTQNVAIGVEALSLNTTNNNTAVGFYALKVNTSGTGNASVGYASLDANTTGSNNTAVGADALTANTTAANNTAVGKSALLSNTTGDTNVAVGKDSMLANTTGTNNTALGTRTLQSNTTAANNVAVGDLALGDNTTGGQNTALGNNALENNTTASYNTAVGYQAGYSNTTGQSSVSIGYRAGYSHTTNGQNTIIGYDAGFSCTGYINTFVGFGSGSTMTTGNNNTILGRYNGNQGGLDIRTSSNNIVLSDGDGNVRIYVDSSGNVGIGATALALFNAVGGSTKLAVTGSSASTNVLGNTDASISIINTDTTANNTAGLHFARADTDNTPNYAGASIVTQFHDTQATGQYPKASMNFLTSTVANAAPSLKMTIASSGNVGIGTSSPATTLQVNGDVTIYGTPSTSVHGVQFRNLFNTGAHLFSQGAATTNTYINWINANGTVGSIAATGSGVAYNTSSDYRLKEDWQLISAASDRVLALKPINFAWIVDGSRVDGFLAHELAEVVPEAVTGTKDAMMDEEYEVTAAVLDDNGMVVTEAVMGTRSVPDYQGIDQSKLVPLLTAALQEALNKIDAMEIRLSALES